ncbi:MAG: lysine transporter LysE [Arcobacter sp.]|nr:MAG: lysine transporter LysE [Arcobacter sp.]
MTFTLILSMISLSFVMAISPGPVNMIIISSSINNGFKRTFAFVSGATIGFTLLLLFIALGFITVLIEYPLFLKILSILGTLFIIYMGYKIATAPTSLEIKEDDKIILKFYQGFLLQWLNPKAWIASISGISIYSSSKEILFTFIFIYFIVCYLSLSFWAIIGKNLQILLNTHKKLKIFNLFMGITLIVTALYLLLL